MTVHNAPPAGASAAVVYGLLERLVAANADIVLCVSSDLSARMRRLGAEVVGRAIVPAPEVRPSGQAAGLGSAGQRPADLPGDRPVILTAAGSRRRRGSAR